MKDIDDWKEFLDKYGVGYTCGVGYTEEYGVGQSLTLGAKSNSKVVGYSSFFAEVSFDKEGNFINIGVWE